MKEWRNLLVENLIHRFKLDKERNPSHVNELLDYLQCQYIYGELSIVEYKNLFFELDKLNAEKPQFYFMNTEPFEEVDIPG